MPTFIKVVIFFLLSTYINLMRIKLVAGKLWRRILEGEASSTMVGDIGWVIHRFVASLLLCSILGSEESPRTSNCNFHWPPTFACKIRT